MPVFHHGRAKPPIFTIFNRVPPVTDRFMKFTTCLSPSDFVKNPDFRTFFGTRCADPLPPGRHGLYLLPGLLAAVARLRVARP